MKTKRFEIVETPEEINTLPKLYFWLEYHSNSVELRVKDQFGNESVILTIFDTGRIVRADGVYPGFGLQLDDRRRIVVE